MRVLACCLLAAMLGFNANPGFAQDRAVVVNGALLGPLELVWLDAINGGFVPDGRYWLDTDSGAWGYEGGPMEGYIGQAQDVDQGAQGDAGGHRYFEDDVADFCARNGGCPW